MAVGTLTAIGTILGTFVTAYGISKQEKANEAANAQGARWREEDTERDEKRYAQETSYRRRQDRKQWQWMEEERDWERKRQIVSDFRSAADKQPQFGGNLINIWRGAR